MDSNFRMRHPFVVRLSNHEESFHGFPFCKGGILSVITLIPLWKRGGRGDFWRERCRHYSTNFRYVTRKERRDETCVNQTQRNRRCQK
jgi:hypothetical protein